MSISTRFTKLLIAAAVIAAVAVVPAGASAALPQLRGVVSGSPYGASGGQMAIPVLFSKMTVRTNGMKSPVGVIILGRTQRVKLPNGGGYSLPVNLRTGDRFKGYGAISSVNQRTFYPRVPLTLRPAIYFRSKELSLGELTAAVQGLQNALVSLQSQLRTLAGASSAAFKDLYQQVADIRAALASLKIPAAVDLSGIQSQIDSLKTQLNGVITSLQGYAKLSDIDKKIADALAGLNLLTTGDVTNTVTSILDTLSFNTTQLGQFVGDTVNGLLGDPAGTLTTTVNGLIGAAINADVPGLIDGKINALNLPGTYATITSLSTTNQTVSDLSASLADAKAKITALTGRLDTVCSALKAGSVTIDPDGGGVLPPVTVPLTLPNIGTACP